jgi:hypothetical protein
MESSNLSGRAPPFPRTKSTLSGQAVRYKSSRHHKTIAAVGFSLPSFTLAFSLTDTTNDLAAPPILYH